jgi:hypothetical protein
MGNAAARAALCPPAPPAVRARGTPQSEAPVPPRTPPKPRAPLRRPVRSAIRRCFFAALLSPLSHAPLPQTHACWHTRRTSPCRAAPQLQGMPYVGDLLPLTDPPNMVTPELGYRAPREVPLVPSAPHGRCRARHGLRPATKHGEHTHASARQRRLCTRAPSERRHWRALRPAQLRGRPRPACPFPCLVLSEAPGRMRARHSVPGAELPPNTIRAPRPAPRRWSRPARTPLPGRGARSTARTP